METKGVLSVVQLGINVLSEQPNVGFQWLVMCKSAAISWPKDWNGDSVKHMARTPCQSPSSDIIGLWQTHEEPRRRGMILPEKKWADRCPRHTAGLQDDGLHRNTWHIAEWRLVAEQIKDSCGCRDEYSAVLQLFSSYNYIFLASPGRSYISSLSTFGEHWQKGWCYVIPLRVYCFGPFRRILISHSGMGVLHFHPRQLQASSV